MSGGSFRGLWGKSFVDCLVYCWISSNGCLLPTSCQVLSSVCVIIRHIPESFKRSHKWDHPHWKPWTLTILFLDLILCPLNWRRWGFQEPLEIGTVGVCFHPNIFSGIQVVLLGLFHRQKLGACRVQVNCSDIEPDPKPILSSSKPRAFLCRTSTEAILWDRCHHCRQVWEGSFAFMVPRVAAPGSESVAFQEQVGR